MRPRKQPLIRLNIQKQNQIAHIHTDRLDLRIGFDDDGDSIDYELRVVGRDLESLGDGQRVDPVSRRLSGSMDELFLKRG